MSNTDIKTDFKVNDIEYNVNKPTAREHRIAQLEYNKVFGEAIKSGAILRAKLNDYMREQNSWSEEKAKQVAELAEQITDSEDKIKRGGIKLSAAIDLAKQTRKNRELLQILLAAKTAAESNCAEGQAENARFNRLLTLCFVQRPDGVPVYKDVDALLNEGDQDRSEAAGKAFDILGKLLYRLDDKFEQKLPENVFLKQWNLIDDKLRYVNEKGQLIDEFNRRINEDGFLVNDDGDIVDVKGNKITQEGHLIVDDPKPFLDENGNPVSPPNKVD